MGISSYSFGTVARVEALVGDVVASRAFATETTPTLAQVEMFLDDAASEMHSAMAEGGYSLVTAVQLAIDAPRAANWLALLNTYGACAMALQSLPYEAQAAALPDAPPSRGNWFRKRFEDGLERIRKSNALARMGLARMGRYDKVFAGSQEDEDGNEKLPFFKRGQFDYEGSRDLTEAAE
ncbi:MAG: hypothetical protein FD153_1481 [Rhodospirillaceae bacterium]|nr:MAG: hypothetical protein FD153_1481 [Rhodospirillaceae bacterium]